MKKYIISVMLLALPAVVSAQSGLEHNWQPLSEGVLVDAVLPAFFNVESYQMEVEILHDVDHPGYYAVAAPYSTANPYYSQITAYLLNDGADGLLVFDARDEQNVILEQSHTGLVYENESVTVNSYTWWEAAGMYPELSYDDRRGTYADGVITFSATPASLWITTASLDALDMGFTPKVDMELRFADARDYSLDIALASWCLTDDGRAVVAAWPGADIARVDAAITAATDTEAQIAAVLANPTALPAQAGAYLDVPENVGSAQRLNIVALGYDADGQVQTVVVEHVYTPDTSTDWAPTEGLAELSDFLGNPASRIKCRVEESTTTPGLLRLVNPMAQSSAGIGHISGYANHTDYLYLDIADPDCVVIYESPLGITMADYGDIRITSDAAADLAAGRDKTYIAATLRAGMMVNRVVSFPETAAVRVGAMTLGSDTWLRVPSADIIIDLSAVNSNIDPVVPPTTTVPIYFTPDGRRIPAPSSSTITLTPNGPILPCR